MIQMRTLSVSDRSWLPTQPLFWRLSRSNSALIVAGHSLRSSWTAFLSNMVRAMAFLQRLLAQYSEISGREEWPGRRDDQGKTGRRDRRLDERAVRGAATAGAGRRGRYLRAGRQRAVR